MRVASPRKDSSEKKKLNKNSFFERKKIIFENREKNDDEGEPNIFVYCISYVVYHRLHELFSR